ncbi:unnamed protein product [Urochloa humidicola]
MAAAAMFSKLSSQFNKLVCGISPPLTADDNDKYRAGLRSLFLLSPSPERQPSRRSSSSSSSPSASFRDRKLPPPEDGDDDETAATSPAEMCAQDDVAVEEAMASSTLPCLAFPSEHGYMLFSLAETRMLNNGSGSASLPPVLGRRLIPSPYGGMALATDVCYNHPCRLVDPFTGNHTPLPNLPVPFSEKEPVEHHPADDPPRRRAGARVTDDGLAWDWSPRGVMVARGDTAFFLPHCGCSEGWLAVHQAKRGSPMTVNYRAGKFFLLELRSLETTVLDAATLRRRATIPPPRGLRGGVEAAYLAPCDDGGAILLVRRRTGEDNGGAQLFTEAYRARGRGGRSSSRWARVRDVGERAVFVDGSHAFTVAAGAAGALANHVYVVLANGVERRSGGSVDVVEYDVGVVDVERPELMWRMGLDVGEVERVWGQPHWIIRRDGSRVGSGQHA